MGLFKKIKKKFKKIKKPLKRVGAGVVTGGLSEVARAAGAKGLATGIESALFPSSVREVVQTASLVAAPATGGLSTVLAGNAGTTGGIPMGIGNVLGGLQGVLGTVSQFGGSLGQVAQVGSGFLSGFLPAQGPIAAPFPQSQFPNAQQTMAVAPQIRGGLQAIGEFLSPILAKISVTLGRSVSLRAAMIIIRRLGKTLTSPVAVATAIGITSAELATLITANAIRGSSGRRMNVANVKALRRAHRRIRGFHKLCGENDRLRAPRRRSSGTKVINVRGGVCS